MQTSTRLSALCAILLLIAMLGLSRAEPEPSADVADKPSVRRVTVSEARRQAEVLHTTVHSTLQLVHHTYFREDEGLPLPAAVMREMFAELESEEQVKLRWLAVEGQAMNTDHLPQTDFEQAAFEALKSGKKSLEQIEDGTYRRAAAITLANQCLKCHVPDRKSTEPRTAGLIVAIPVASEE